MSDLPMPTATVPRIVPPHPRYPGGRDRLGRPQVGVSLERRAESAVVAAERAGRAERAVAETLSAQLARGTGRSGSEVVGAAVGAVGAAGATVVEPVLAKRPAGIFAEREKVEGDEKTGAIRTMVIEPAVGEVGNGEAAGGAAEKKLSWIRRQRLPKESPVLEVSGEPSPYNSSQITAEKKGFWERLKQRGKSEEGEDIEKKAGDGPELEAWVDGIEDEEIKIEKPSVRAVDAEMPVRSGYRRSTLAGKRHLVAAVGMACAFAFGIWVLWQSDGKAPEDGSLVPVVTEARQPNPVHTQLSHFLNRFEFDGNLTGMSGWKDYDTETLGELVQKNGSALELILSCLAERDWEPQHPAWRTGNLAGDLPWADLARVKQAEALYLQRRGLEVGAFRSAFDLMEFGRKIQEVEGWPNYFLTGLDVYHRGLETVAQLVDDTRMDSAQLGALQRTFAAHIPPGEPELVTFFRASYGLEKAILQGESAPARPGDFSFHMARPDGILFKPNRTLALFADAFSSLIEDAPKPHYERTRMDLSDSESASLLDSNRTGRRYFATAMLPYAEIPEKQALSVAHYEAVTTLVALRRHGLDLGRLPDTLADLDTTYLKVVPSDPFDGDELRYSKNRKVVYSTGADRVDSGGKPGRTGFSNRDEPTLEITFSAGGDSEFH